MVKFDTSKFEQHLIAKIVGRAVRLLDARTEKQALTMDITACHCNGTCLDLQKLLDSGDFDFLHDVVGISTHIDRRTGELTNCFLPRFAMPDATIA